MTSKSGRCAKPRSMHGLLLLLMSGLALLSMVILSVAIAATGILSALDEIAFRSLHNHAVDGISSLSNELTMIANSARQTADRVGNRLGEQMQQQHFTLAQAQGDIQKIDGLLSSSADSLTGFLESNSASGAFVLLNLSYTDQGQYASLYFRDSSPRVGAETNAGYSIVRGHSRLLGDRKFPLDKGWAYQQAAGSDDRYIHEPQRAAALYPKADKRDWGYWSMPFCPEPGDTDIVTFTTPLMDAQGQVMGIFGVEFSLRYLSQIIPSENLPFEKGFYLIGALGEGYIDSQTAFSASPLGTRLLMENPGRVPYQVAVDKSGYTIYQSGDGEGVLYLSMKSLGLYGQNSPFKGEEYYLIALAPRDMVLRSSFDITVGIGAALVITLATSFIAAQFLSQAFASRIENLATQVREMPPDEPLVLSPVNIREIDELSDALQQMSRDVRMYAARMSNIVDMVGIPMGAFEMDADAACLNATDSIYRMFEVDKGSLNCGEFIALLPGMALPEQDGAHAESEIFCPVASTGADRWLRVHLLRRAQRLYGTIIDITNEVRQKQWLEFERDYDPLTKLLNRNSYPRQMTALIEAKPDQSGALVFGDLDNLKALNDTYGHDMGDRYIRTAADALRLFEEHGGVVARVSGDEFVVYLHGERERGALRSLIDSTMERVRQTCMRLPDGTEQKVRISVGIAYYPTDAEAIDELIRYADFAMYEIKNSIKGGTREFDPRSYAKNSFILRKPNQLDRLLDEKRVRFAFQPIIDVRTGGLLGFEALMRPLMREFHTPLEVLALAKSQSKLYQVENMVLSRLFEYLDDHIASYPGMLWFVNLVANHILAAEDFEKLCSLFSGDCDRIVMEITEGEYAAEETLRAKVRAIREAGFLVALDDYGTGYNGEVLLLWLAPNYLKVDMSIVRNIHLDRNRQRIMRTIVEYANENQIQVIAEGVENAQELDTVIQLGVGYVQGFYTGMPSFEPGTANEDACREAADLYRRHYGG